MPTADTLLATYRDDVATLPPDIADEVAAAQLALSVAQDAVDEATTRLGLAQERADAADSLVDLYIAERNATLLLALHVKLDGDGCPVPRQGAPRGPRQRPADPPPAMQAGEEPGAQPGGVALFNAAASDRGPEEPLGVILTRLCDTAISDWSAADLLDVPEAAVRVIDRHRIGAAEAQAIEGDRVKVDGRWWTMSDDARVIA